MDWVKELEWLEANNTMPDDYIEYRRQKQRTRAIAEEATKQVLILQRLCKEMLKALEISSEEMYARWDGDESARRQVYTLTVLRKARRALGDETANKGCKEERRCGKGLS